MPGDPAALLGTCRQKNLPAALERSRSGRGGARRRGGMAERRYRALGRGNSVTGRSPRNGAVGASGGPKATICQILSPRLRALIEPAHDSGVSPMNPTSHVQFERPCRRSARNTSFGRGNRTGRARRETGIERLKRGLTEEGIPDGRDISVVRIEQHQGNRETLFALGAGEAGAIAG